MHNACGTDYANPQVPLHFPASTTMGFVGPVLSCSVLRCFCLEGPLVRGVGHTSGRARFSRRTHQRTCQSPVPAPALCDAALSEKELSPASGNPGTHADCDV